MQPNMRRVHRPQGFGERRWTEEGKQDPTFNDFTDLVMQRKYNDEGEFFINFFERCNLKCGFCYQKHDDWTGIENIADKADQVLERAEQLKGRYKGFQINMMGGELFMDEVSDLAFDDYLSFATIIEAYSSYLPINGDGYGSSIETIPKGILKIKDFPDCF